MLRDLLSDGPVKGDDSGVIGLSFSGELLQNIVLVNLELLSSMSECKEIGIVSEIECDGPVPMHSDRF